MTDYAKRHRSRMSKTTKAVKKWGFWKDAKGASDYRVKSADGQWYSDWMDGFAAAVEYRKQADKTVRAELRGRT